MQKIRRPAVLALLLGGLLATAGCRSKPAAPVDQRAVQESLIRSADQACLQAVRSKTAERVIHCFTQHAVWAAPGTGPIKGHDAILSQWRKFFLQPDFSMSWRTSQIVAARSGEIGYTLYDYQMTARLNQSKQPVTVEGPGLAIWKRQLDGKWKMDADFLARRPAASQADTTAKGP
jgi:ketosteroid isomerase-like protein